MRRAAIVAPLRTPVGRFGGALKSYSASDLAAKAISAVLESTSMDPNAIDEVIIAQSYGSGEAPCIARYAALEAGLPIHIPGYTVDRRCGSGLQAVINAGQAIQTSGADVVLVVGVESMSNIEYYTTDVRWGARAGSFKMHDRLQRARERSQPVSRFGYISGMPETAENLALQYNIRREEADEYALLSHQKAARAQKDGLFDKEIIPIEYSVDRRTIGLLKHDEGVRHDASIESLSKLAPMREGGTVTPGNSCQQSDAAAACLVMSESALTRWNQEPMAFIDNWAAVGCDPKYMGIGPVPAVSQLLRKASISIDAFDLIEVNEAFASQTLAVLREWPEVAIEKVNVNGSGISLGHPIGATGIRIMTTLLHEMRRTECKLGLETMCIGGGQGLAAMFSRF